MVEKQGGHDHSSKMGRCLKHIEEDPPDNWKDWADTLAEAAHKICYSSVKEKGYTPESSMDILGEEDLSKDCPHCDMLQRRIIEGFATVDIVDKQGDEIEIPGVVKSLNEFFLEETPLLHLEHQSIPVGRLLSVSVKNHTRSGKEGIWIRGEIFSKYTVHDDVWKAIKDGKLSAFSIKGKPLEAKKKCDGISCWRVIPKFELVEISVVQDPANEEALIETTNTSAKSDCTFLQDAFKGFIEKGFGIPLTPRFGDAVRGDVTGKDIGDQIWNIAYRGCKEASNFENCMAEKLNKYMAEPYEKQIFDGEQDEEEETIFGHPVAEKKAVWTIPDTISKKWVPYDGPRGGKGARNTETGKVVYGQAAQALLGTGPKTPKTVSSTTLSQAWMNADLKARKNWLQGFGFSPKYAARKWRDLPKEVAASIVRQSQTRGKVPVPQGEYSTQERLEIESLRDDIISGRTSGFKKALKQSQEDIRENPKMAKPVYHWAKKAARMLRAAGKEAPAEKQGMFEHFAGRYESLAREAMDIMEWGGRQPVPQGEYQNTEALDLAMSLDMPEVESAIREGNLDEALRIIEPLAMGSRADLPFTTPDEERAFWELYDTLSTDEEARHYVPQGAEMDLGEFWNQIDRTEFLSDIGESSSYADYDDVRDLPPGFQRALKERMESRVKSISNWNVPSEILEKLEKQWQPFSTRRGTLAVRDPRGRKLYGRKAKEILGEREPKSEALRHAEEYRRRAAEQQKREAKKILQSR